MLSLLTFAVQIGDAMLRDKFTGSTLEVVIGDLGRNNPSLHES